MGKRPAPDSPTGPPDASLRAASVDGSPRPAPPDLRASLGRIGEAEVLVISYDVSADEEAMWPDEALESEPPKVVSRPTARVRVDRGSKEAGDARPQPRVSEAGRQGEEEAKGLQQGHDAGFTEAQGGSTLAIVQGGSLELLELGDREHAIVGDTRLGGLGRGAGLGRDGRGRGCCG